MNRSLALLLGGLATALTIILSAAWAWRPAGPYEPAGQGDIYLALGDSLAWGFRLDAPERESYPALIHAGLAAEAPIALENLAFPGETSGSFLGGQLPRALRLIEAARAEGLRVSPITLDIGGNDLRNVERAGPAEREAAVARAGQNIGRILDELRRAAGGDADIAVMTYYNPYGGDPAAEGSEAYWIERLNATIRAEAERRGVAVADVHPAFEGGRAYTHTFILFQDIHANAQGHALIAAIFQQALGYP